MSELFQTLEDITRQGSRHGVFNFLLSNGQALFAHCSTNLFYIIRQWPFSTAHLIDADMEVDFSQTNHAGDRVSVIATQPLTDNEEWTPFGEGELIIEDTYGTHSVKLAAGDLVLYPGTSLHNVTPITRGSRIASFFWTQSLIRDDGRRALMFDLDSSIRRLATDHPEHPSVVSLTSTYHNLLRQWAEL